VTKSHPYGDGETAQEQKGQADYEFQITKNNSTSVKMKGTVTGTIEPGNAKPPQTVSMSGTLQDPFVFSDSDPDANFGFMPGGLDYSFSLLRGRLSPALYRRSRVGGRVRGRHINDVPWTPGTRGDS
jgi:hypothetical protein